MADHESVPFPGERRCGNFRGRNGDWHRNRQGNPCGKLLGVGAICCKFHGGATTRAKRATARRASEMEAHEHARRLVDARAGTGATEAEILLDYLWTLNAQYRIFNSMAADLDNAGEVSLSEDPEMIGKQRGYAFRRWVPAEINDDGEIIRKGHVETRIDPLMVEGKDLAHLHPFVVHASNVGKELHAVLKTCAVLQIADRQIRIAERNADTLFKLLETFADALQVTREQRKVGFQAVQAKMQKMELVS